jgi:hypothetical protein
MAAVYDISEFVDWLPEYVQSHRLPGPDPRYQRYCQADGRDSGTGLDAYGCADAANILYTIGLLPREALVRQQWIEVLRGFQRAGDGVFVNETHSDEHTTAHLTAALELFDARPLHPLHFMAPCRMREGIEQFLDALNWRSPWEQSHRGAGVGAAFLITEAVRPEWFDWYFGWLDGQVDPQTGFWRRGMIDRGDLFAHLAGSFHYHFNYVAARRAIPHPERVIDASLELMLASGLFHRDGELGFADIDGVFCIHRALRQCGHRHGDCMAALRRMLAAAVELVTDRAYRESRVFDDIHNTFGAVCCLAELQQALPGELRTPRPLRQVLDRRPFI